MFLKSDKPVPKKKPVDVCVSVKCFKIEEINTYKPLIVHMSNHLAWGITENTFENYYVV